MNRLFLKKIFLLGISLWISARSHAQDHSEIRVQGAVESMVLVRGGRFQMGIDAREIPRFQNIFGINTAELFKDEIPKHWVTVADFQIDKNLVTNAEFKKFTDANPQWQPGHVRGDLDNGNYLKRWKLPNTMKEKGNHPVVNVNWYAAVAYCQWEGKRLPTEAEWEYAARGGIAGLFPWGNEMADSSRANFGGVVGSTTAVGKYPANPNGLFDMAGNVWEFLADEWAPYSSTEQKDPVSGGNRFVDGTTFLHVTTRRVIRGGSFEGAPVNLWVEYRDSHPLNGSREFVGFRCAK